MNIETIMDTKAKGANYVGMTGLHDTKPLTETDIMREFNLSEKAQQIIESIVESTANVPGLRMHLYVDDVKKDFPVIQGIGFEHGGLDYFVTNTGETYELEDSETRPIDLASFTNFFEQALENCKQN